jgi:biotin operon repressor
MARLIGGSHIQLTMAEQRLLDFLQTNKGNEYTAHEIEEEIGIPAIQVDRIMDNLRFKGFEVCSEPRRGVHYFANNTIWSYIVGGSLIAIIIIMFFFGWLDYLDSCPGCPPEDYQIESLEE